MARSVQIRPSNRLFAGRPVLVTFQCNHRCNSAYEYCDLLLNQGRYEMTRQEIRAVFGQLYDESIRFVLVQGGEPLLCPDLVDVLQDIFSRGLLLTLVSNGTRLTEDLEREFPALRLPLFISLDTAGV